MEEYDDEDYASHGGTETVPRRMYSPQRTSELHAHGKATQVGLRFAQCAIILIRKW
jgi:hypothetical protein